MIAFQEQNLTDFAMKVELGRANCCVQYRNRIMRSVFPQSSLLHPKQTIAVIGNPRARGFRRGVGLAARLQAPLQGDDQLFLPRSIAELDEVIEGCKQRGVGVIAVCGGDGTLHQTLCAMHRVYSAEELPQVCILRGGTLNTVAHGLRMRGLPVERLKRLVNARNQGAMIHSYVRPLLAIEDRVGFIFGNGIVIDFLKEYYHRKQPNQLIAAVLAAKAVIQAWLAPDQIASLTRGVRLTMRCDDALPAPFSGLGLAAATVPEIGLGFAPFRRYIQEADRFAIWGYRGSLRSFSLRLPKIYLGFPDSSSNVSLAAQAKRLELVSEQPFSYTIDGDVYECEGRLRLELGPSVTLLDVPG